MTLGWCSPFYCHTSPLHVYCRPPSLYCLHHTVKLHHHTVMIILSTFTIVLSHLIIILSCYTIINCPLPKDAILIIERIAMMKLNSTMEKTDNVIMVKHDSMMTTQWWRSTVWLWQYNGEALQYEQYNSIVQSEAQQYNGENKTVQFMVKHDNMMDCHHCIVILHHHTVGLHHLTVNLHLILLSHLVFCWP